MTASGLLKSGVAFLCLLANMGLAAAEHEARLSWADPLDMGPLVTGVISDVWVGAGQQVKKGQPLISLDDREFRARLMASQASVNAEQANYAEAKHHTQRGDELYERGALSGLKADLRRVAEANNRAVFLSAVAKRDLAKLDLERSQLLAPFAAKIVSISAAPGQVVITRFESKSLLTLVAHGRMRARTLIGIDLLARLESGMAVPVLVAGNEYQGKVVVLGLTPEGSNTYRLEVEFSHDPEHALKAGQNATIRLP